MQSSRGVFTNAGPVLHCITNAIDGVGQTQSKRLQDLADNPLTQFLAKRLIILDAIRGGTVDGDEEPRSARQSGGDSGDETVALQTMNMDNRGLQSDNLPMQHEEGFEV
jgi:hypothetical protein